MTRAVAEPGSSDLPSRDSDNKNRVKHPAYPNVDAGLSMPEGVPDKLLAFRDLRTIGDVQVAHTGYLPGEMEVPPLRGYAVNLLLSGSGSLVTKLGDKTWKGPQIAGSVEVFSGNTHQERALDGSISESVNVLLDESIVKRAANEVGVELAQLEILDSLHARDPQVGQLLLSFLSEVKSDSLGGELYTQSLATALAVHLLREHSSLGERKKKEFDYGQHQGGEAGGLSARALKAATDYIGDYLASEITLQGIARQANLSERHFSRLFKESTGLSPHQYVIRERVEKARSLLMSTDLSVGEVAISCGFSHQGHLARHFVRQVGTSPTRFRALQSTTRAPRLSPGLR